jgi:adenine-specific DNA-methyltransferase
VTDVSLRRIVADALSHFTAPSLLGPAMELFGAVGYRSNRRFDVNPAGGHALLEALGLTDTLNTERALLSHWRAAELIFQLTAEEISSAGQMALFDTRQVDQTRIESYLFLAIDLSGASYTRTELATITREINRHLLMPVLVLFRHGATLTFAVIDRRIHKLNEARDVLEKVTLIKDIAFAQPHRAHIEILADLSLPQLAREASVSNFVELHRAWRTVLDSSALNRRFYREVANWYFWAVEQVEFPAGAQDDRAVRNATSLIRLITRVIFVWFLKEKGLIPDDLFNPRRLREILTSLAHDESSYYQAILQNLFFATLNQEMNTPQRPTNRTFRGEGRQHYNITTLYRHKARFRDPEAALALFATIPFLNGGLFECLDKPDADGKIVRVDGFSDRTDVPLRVPNELFFGAEHAVDLNATYGTSGKHYQVAGLITILQRYKFTVSENTPIEEEVALDPELLGQVFENLLAAYNPETQTTARKQTGSFYTPRPIVNYMVDEALVAYLEENLHQATRLSLVLDAAQLASLNTRLRDLMTYTEADHGFSPDEVRHLIIAINNVKILDPAAGSGAFPMGVLQKLVHLLTRLDPDNTRWKEQQRARAIEETKGAFEIGDHAERERRLLDINEAFEYNSSDYGRKLYLIENCIYGVDIQPIAIQIAKLRCFISLVVDQRIDDTRENRGIRPLPNLETKFVAANTLVGIPRPDQMSLRDPEIDQVEAHLREVRAHHFSARTPKTKAKYREQDKELRTRLAGLLRRDDFSGDTATMLASWEPYDQNAKAPFFDSEWMFGLRDGFDITLGNPPYVRADGNEIHLQLRKQIEASEQYETLWEKWDLFIAFIELGYKLLRQGGVSTMIVSDAFCHAKYAQKLQTWLLTHSRVLRLDFFGKIRIFDAAVHNITYLVQRADGTHHRPERHVHDPEFGVVHVLPTDEQQQLTYRAFFPEDTERQEFVHPTIDLETVCYISVGMVVHADEKQAQGAFELSDLVSDVQDDLHPKPFVEGKHLVRWLPSTNKWLEWGTQRAPALFRRSTFPQLYEVAEKLISVDMSAGVGQLRVVYDDQKLYHNHSAWSFTPWHSLRGVRNNSLKKAARYYDEKPRPDLPQREVLEKLSQRFSVKYLLGVMNSSAARDFLRANRRSNIHLYPDDWKQLPIPDVEMKDQQPVIKLVDRILAEKRKNIRADIATLEQELDQVIHQLYGIVSAKSTSKDAIANEDV